MNEKKLKHKKSRVVLILLSVLLIALTVWIIVGENIITVVYYDVDNKIISHPFRIVMVSDLHNKTFGENNKVLIDKVNDQQPDIIAVLGDMNIQSVEDLSVLSNTVSQLAKIAPVYYVLGNHESNYDYGAEKVIKEIQSINGVTLLQNEVKHININGNRVALCGMDDEIFREEKCWRALQEVSDSNDEYRLVLWHYPEDTELFEWHQLKYDLMLSGHTHGGLVNIPFVGRIYAPASGWFPWLVYGDYSTLSGRLIITSGLGRSSYIPRINNYPEIAVVNIEPKNE